MFKKFLCAMANGVIRTITVMNITGVKFFLLPKREIWSKGNRRSRANKKKSSSRKEEYGGEAAGNAKILKLSRRELFGELEFGKDLKE